MEFLSFFQGLLVAMAAFLLFMSWRIVYSCFILPNLAYKRLRANGFCGPTPYFPLGNINDMKKISSTSTSSSFSHDIHPIAFPYFAQWKKSHGKVFTYWLGTEAFLYIADPEFLKRIASGVMGKSWGKPTVFKKDREPMFGRGLVMVEGEDWVRHRHVITPAFTPANLKAMSSLMVESANNMLDRWITNIKSDGNPEFDLEKEIINTAGEIIAKTSFGLSYENGRQVFEKLRAMQMTLFKSNRFVGVPFSKFMCPQNLKAAKLGKEIDALLLSIITARSKSSSSDGLPQQQDLLGMLMAENGMNGRLRRTLTKRELIDECKTFFFAGHETTALALTWTLLCLAMHPKWQDQLREEIRDVMGDDGEIDSTMLAGLKKMGWVMNEVLRLYSPAPNAQRQTREKIRIEDQLIPEGTNIWIDVVSMHHDKDLWGETVNEFRPERFKDNLYGGCKHKMGFLPFGFGGRMCIGRNLAMMEYKIVLSLILRKFSLSISPNYRHSPSIVLSLRPSQGMPLILTPL